MGSIRHKIDTFAPSSIFSVKRKIVKNVWITGVEDACSVDGGTGALFILLMVSLLF
jgi:hypothetical protein